MHEWRPVLHILLPEGSRVPVAPFKPEAGSFTHAEELEPIVGDRTGQQAPANAAPVVRPHYREDRFRRIVVRHRHYNEGRELTEYRIQQFGLSDFVDFFVSSCFVHLRKPDVDIFKMAIDLANVPPEQTVYVDDRKLFVEVAGTLGLKAIQHTSYEETRRAFQVSGLA